MVYKTHLKKKKWWW